MLAILPLPGSLPCPVERWPTPAALPPFGRTSRARRLECVDDPDEEDDLVEEEEDLTVAQPADDESNFDDFDDEFDDDFEEDENDPDWDHPDDATQEPPPPGKGPGRKK